MSSLPVLAVDLDETLIRNDILYESLWTCASQDMPRLFRALASLPWGKARFKERLSRHVAIDPAQLSYNREVLDYIQDWRARGGMAILVTATDQKVAKAVADHLGVFDEVHGSDGARNLKGSAKAGFLIERYGAGNYDYIGDAEADIPVWKSARRAVTVGLSPKERSRVDSLGGDVLHLGAPARSIMPYLKALRPYQWAKNSLVFLPLIAAHEASISSWIDAVLAFTCFSLVASSVYVLNDLLDLAADRAHPRKRERPFASGAIPLLHGSWMAAGLLLGGLMVGLGVERLEFLGVVLLYYIITLAYSLSLKRQLIIDICTLACLYTLRIFAGGTATGLPISQWLLAFSIFFFLSLAAVKRHAELVDVVQAGRGRPAGRGYEGEDRPIVATMAIGAGYVAVLVLAFYLDTPIVRQLYRHADYLWGLCPILLYWISHMVMMSHRGRMHDDPIVFAVKDNVSRLCAFLVFLVIVLGTM